MRFKQCTVAIKVSWVITSGASICRKNLFSLLFLIEAELKHQEFKRIKWIRTWSPISVYLWRGRERWLPKVLRRSGMSAIRDFSQVRAISIFLFLRTGSCVLRSFGAVARSIHRRRRKRNFLGFLRPFSRPSPFPVSSRRFFWSAIAHFPFSQFVGGVLLFLLALLRSRQSSRGVNNKPTLRVFLGDLPNEPS